MPKFRPKTVGSTSTYNYEGGKAYTLPEKEELLFSVLTSFIEDSFYESKNTRLTRIAELVTKIAEKDPLFVANLAVITRREFHMRSAFHVLVGELAKVHKGDSLVRDVIIAGTERPDDLMEIAAYVGKPIPNQIKKGIASAIGHFNEYQLAKYKGEGRAYSLVDIFNLTHPKPTRQNKGLYERVIEGTLTVPETWETMLSAGEGHDVVWKTLLLENKLGYMALLRNLRNIIEHADEETLDLAITKLTDEDAVLKSKQLPFRFLTAYRMLEQTPSEKTPQALEAIETAMDISVANLPHLSGLTYATADNSGSMSRAISDKSSVKLEDIANTFLAISNKLSAGSITTIFGDTCKAKIFPLRSGVLANVRTIQNGEVGHSTNAWAAMKYLLDSGKKVNRIVLFSDMQCYDSYERPYQYGNRTVAEYIREYRRTINQNVYVYSIDLAGYGTAQTPTGEKNTFRIAGWSDKIFDFMQAVESHDNMVEYVEDYDFSTEEEQ
jgi:60 kDa SS-A/Ro ribonucleoprotein